MNELKRFWNEEDGLATLEIVLIIVVLVALAIIFRDVIFDAVGKLLGTVKEKTGDFGDKQPTVQTPGGK